MKFIYSKPFRKNFAPLTFTLPLIFVLSVLVVYPVAENFFLSFSRLEGSFYERTFASFDNYLYLFKDTVFWQSLKNTFVYVVGTVVFSLLLGFFAAMVLNQEFKGRAFFRVAIMASWISPMIVNAKVWEWLYQSDYGIINSILRSLDLSILTRSWLSDPDIALFCIIAVMFWREFPFVALMLLTGMQSIDKSLYEASQIDGAGSWQRMLFVTLPCLSPIIKRVTFVLIFWGLNTVTLVYAMTGGGPGNSTIISGLYIYQKAFVFGRYELASAASVILFIISLVFIIPYTLSAVKESA